MKTVMSSAEALGFKCSENEPMRFHTTFSVGGPAELFIECNDVERLPTLLSDIKSRNLKYTVIGNGSNLLVSDSGIKGVVICICDGRISVSDDCITAAAGARLSKLCIAARDNGLSGLEFAFGIPGTVGGAVYMNAGAYGGEVSDVLAECTSLNANGETVTRETSLLELGYRSSIFKSADEIILSAEFRLKRDESAKIKERMDDFAARRREKQPLEYPSAGSTFKRPTGYFAGALIEQCGLKGCSVGGAEVSEKHAGFIINKGNACADDIEKLIDRVIKTVKAETGVLLEPEVITLK